MDTKKINALLMAVERGSLTAAAQELGYTQSGLTHMMNSLEDELGLNLLVRSKNGVHLSPAGQELRQKMEELLETARELDRLADSLRQRSFTTLRLGAYTSVARQWLPAVLAEFREQCPDTDVTIEVGGIVDVYEKLKNDELDCAIVSYHEAMCQGLRTAPLAEDALLAILPADGRFSDAPFPIGDFAGEEFLMPAAGFDLDIEPLFDGGVERIASRVRHTNLDDAAIVSMVAHGLGVSILSALIIRDMREQVIAAPLDPPASRLLCIAMRENRQGDRNIRRFVRCAQSVVEQMYGGTETAEGV